MNVDSELGAYQEKLQSGLRLLEENYSRQLLLMKQLYDVVLRMVSGNIISNALHIL